MNTVGTNSPTKGWNTLHIDQWLNLVSEPGLRFYSPGLGRWMSRDPVGERWASGLYLFVKNDSIDLVDVDGRFALVFESSWAPAMQQLVSEAYNQVKSKIGVIRARLLALIAATSSLPDTCQYKAPWLTGLTDLLGKMDRLVTKVASTTPLKLEHKTLAPDTAAETYFWDPLRNFPRHRIAFNDNPADPWCFFLQSPHERAKTVFHEFLHIVRVKEEHGGLGGAAFLNNADYVEEIFDDPSSFLLQSARDKYRQDYGTTNCCE